MESRCAGRAVLIPGVVAPVAAIARRRSSISYSAISDSGVPSILDHARWRTRRDCIFRDVTYDYGSRADDRSAANCHPG